MGRSGNPVLSEDQKRKISMRGGGGGGPKRGGGGRGGGGGGGGPSGRGRSGGPPGRGGFGGPPAGPPGFAQARYGFFTNDMPSGPIGHVNKQFVDSRPPGMMATPSASSVGGGNGPIRPPNGGPLIFPPTMRGAGPGGDDWIPPPRSLLEPLGGPPSFGGGGRGGGGGLPMPPSSNGAGPSPARSGSSGGSIHELFGKMVWKKMEALEDESEVNSLQNEIMDLIAKAVRTQQERKAKEEEERPRNGSGDCETIPYGRPHAANNGDAPAYGNMAEFGGYKPYQGPGFF